MSTKWGLETSKNDQITSTSPLTLSGIIYVSPDQQSAIIEKYINAYQDDLSSTSELSSDDAYLIYSLIYGDLLFIAGNFNQARNYRKEFNLKP